MLQIMSFMQQSPIPLAANQFPKWWTQNYAVEFNVHTKFQAELGETEALLGY